MTLRPLVQALPEAYNAAEESNRMMAWLAAILFMPLVFWVPDWNSTNSEAIVPFGCPGLRV